MIQGAVNSVSANTTYEERGSEVFSRPQEGFWPLFTDQRPVSGKQLGVEIFGPSPGVAELTSDRVFGGLRGYLKTIPVLPYSTKPSLELDRLDVDGDVTGAMAKRLTDFLAAGPWFWDKIITDILITNTATGIDGVSLINDSHPNASGGGTWDNKTTSALGHASFDAGVSAMRVLTGENGEPLGINPTHLMVGPNLARTALEVAGAVRPVPFSASAQDASSSIVAVTNMPNVYEGIVKVIINPRMTSSTDWLLFDLSKPGVRPMALGELSAPRAVAVTDPASEPVVKRSKYQYYIEAYGAAGPLYPHVAYGRLN